MLYDLEVLTYVEYRAVSGVFHNSDPPPPLHPASVSPPAPKAGGYTDHTHSPGGEGAWGGGVNILKDARHWIGLLQYNLSMCTMYRINVVR